LPAFNAKLSNTKCLITKVLARVFTITIDRMWMNANWVLNQPWHTKFPSVKCHWTKKNDMVTFRTKVIRT
jgi:hypothetical protein